MIIKKLIVLVCFAAVFIATFTTVWLLIFSKQNLTINIDNSDIHEVTLYKITPGDDGEWSQSQKPVKTVSTSQTYRLPKGEYGILFKGDNDYAQQTKTVKLGNSAETVVIDPDFSSQHLNQVLTTEKDAVHAAAQKAFPLISSGYKFSEEKLFFKGDWYVAYLTNLNIIDSYGYSDSNVLIMHKKDNIWVSAIKKPDLLISHYDYPDIPQTVLNASLDYYKN